MTFNLKVIKAEHGLSNREIAKACNVAESTVTNWCTGKSEPTISKAKAIADLCGCKLADLMRD